VLGELKTTKERSVTYEIVKFAWERKKEERRKGG